MAIFSSITRSVYISQSLHLIRRTNRVITQNFRRHWQKYISLILSNLHLFIEVRKVSRLSSESFEIHIKILLVTKFFSIPCYLIFLAHPVQFYIYLWTVWSKYNLCRGWKSLDHWSSDLPIGARNILSENRFCTPGCLHWSVGVRSTGVKRQ